MTHAAPRDARDGPLQAMLHTPRAAVAVGVFACLIVACALGPLAFTEAGAPIAQALVAGRVSLALAMAAATVALLVGLAAGAAAGHAALGAHGAATLMLFGSIAPPIAVVAAVAGFVDEGAAFGLAAAGTLGWLHAARASWRAGHALARRPYVDAARLASLAPRTIVWRHIVPNLFDTVAAAAIVAVPVALLVEASIGAVDLAPSGPAGWGVRLRDGLAASDTAALLPSAALLLIACASAGALAHALRRARRD